MSAGGRRRYRYRQDAVFGRLRWLVSVSDHHFCAARPVLLMAWRRESRARRLVRQTAEAAVARVALAEEHPHLSLLCL